MKCINLNSFRTILALPRKRRTIDMKGSGFWFCQLIIKG